MFRPAIKLLEEIVDRKTVYSGIISGVFFITLGTIIAPMFLWLLLRGNNTDFIEHFAIGLSEKYIDDDE